MAVNPGDDSEAATWKLARQVLNDAQYDVLVLRLMQGMSWRTIALELGVSRQTAKDRYDRAIQIVQQRKAA